MTVPDPMPAAQAHRARQRRRLILLPIATFAIAASITLMVMRRDHASTASKPTAQPGDARALVEQPPLDAPGAVAIAAPPDAGRSVPAVAPDAAPACSQVVTIVPAGVPEDKRAFVQATLFRHCTEDGWSADAVTCFLAKQGDPRACADRLAITQRKRLEQSLATPTNPTTTPVAKPSQTDASVSAPNEEVGSVEPEGASGFGEVKSDPEGATVFLDGKRVGKTPWLGPLKVGRYKVAITAPGYQRVERTIEVQEDWTATVDVDLTKI